MDLLELLTRKQVLLETAFYIQTQIDEISKEIDRYERKNNHNNE